MSSEHLFWSFVVGMIAGLALTAMLLEMTGMRAHDAASAACVQQGYTSGTYENGKVICEQIERKELGAK